MGHYNKIEQAGIFGHNGSTWAQHKMEHTQQYYNEITDIIALFSSPEDAYSKGFSLNGNTFVLLRIEDEKTILARGKAPNTCPLTIQKTNQALVIGIGEKEAQPGSLTVAVGKIADYIESVGY